MLDSMMRPLMGLRRSREPLRSATMRFPAFTALFLFLLPFCALAELPEVVVSQLRVDVRSAIIRLAPKGYTPPVQEVDETLKLVVREMNAVNDPFVLTPEELVAFRKDETGLSYEELTRVMNALKKGVNNKPLPHMLAFYDHLLDGRALSPRQKILCYRMTMHAAVSSKVVIPPAPVAKP